MAADMATFVSDSGEIVVAVGELECVEIEAGLQIRRAGSDEEVIARLEVRKIFGQGG